MSNSYDIEMSIDDTLELDTIIEKWNLNENLISVDRSEYNLEGIQTKTAVFDPTGTGEYNITINGQELNINVIKNTTVPDSVLTENLIAWYRFEDGDARDYTNDLDENFADSNAYDGTVNGAEFKQDKGVTDFSTKRGAFDFDGTESSISVNHSFANDFGSDSFSLSFWIKTNNNTGRVIANRDYNSGFIGFVILIKSDGSLKFTLDNGSTSEVITETTNSVADGNYKHITAVRDNENDDTPIYVNGSKVSTNMSGGGGVPSNYGSISFTGEPTEIGAEKGSGYFNGIIDDVRVYNKALNSSEISNIYETTKP
jgi:hypothetical protein